MNELVTDFEKLLGRLIGEDIQLTTDFRSEGGLVRVDPGQMEQVLMNLVVNARDAMPQGGTPDDRNARRVPGRRLRTAAHGRSARTVRTPDRRGHRVRDGQSDARCASSSRSSPPSRSARGPGSGLAMVYGVVKASGGHAAVSKASRAAGRRSICTSRPSTSPSWPRSPPSRHSLPPGTETVLLVEDEVGVRTLARQALESRGYRRARSRGWRVAALRLCREYDGEIDLLLSDVVMPRMSGRELREQIAILSPRTRVIFTSGYTDDAIVRHGVYQAESDFLQKPFTVHGLLRKVREVLDRAPDFRGRVARIASN